MVALMLKREDSPIIFWAIVVVMGGAGGILFIGYFIPNLVMSRQFSLRIYSDRIVCESPHRSLAPAFDLPLSEIQFLEHDARGDAESWTIVTHDQKRHFITHNYGNPVKRIVKILMAAEPPLKVVKLTVWKSPWAKK